MKLLTIDEILAKRELPVEVVEVPEWGGTVRVQGLSAGEADAFNKSLQRRGPNGQMEMDREHYCARLLARCLVDEKGERVCSDANIMLLSQLSAAPITRLTVIAERLSGMRPEAIEDLAKN